jgi:tetratricopeptide (TPR) repeat protein
LTAAFPPGYAASMIAMSNRLRRVAPLIVATVLGCSAPLGAWAQTAQPSPPLQPPQSKPAPKDQAPPRSPPAAQRQSQSALPSTPAEREKVLNDLYALLATADDEESAKAVADAIERVWLHSGSATIDLLMERSMKAVSDKKLDLAKKLLDNVVELAPDYTEAWNRRAYVYFVGNDVEHALGDLRRVLALDPNHFKALDGFAQILREIGQKKAALQAFRQLLDVHPYWEGAKQAVDELEREVDGQGI